MSDEINLNLERHFPKAYHPDFVTDAVRSRGSLMHVLEQFIGPDIRVPSLEATFEAGYALGHADALARNGINPDAIIAYKDGVMAGHRAASAQYEDKSYKKACEVIKRAAELVERENK